MTRRNLILLIVLFLSAAATAQRTTRKGLRVTKTESVNSYDTVSVASKQTDGDTPKITLAGYDKPLRSNRETMFVTNLTNNTVKGLRLELNYYDMHGKKLHSRQCDIDCDIPAGETRQISLRSWDTQHSFVYRLSTRPRQADATPYDVVCNIIYYLTEP